MELEGEDSDDSEEGQNIAEDGDNLGVPETAHGWDAQYIGHGELIWRRGGGGGLGRCTHDFRTAI